MAKDENKILPPIEKNPFYKHYQYDISTLNNCIVKTNSYEWVKKPQLKSKIMFKKSSLPYSPHKAKIVANEWLPKNFEAINDEGNWTQNLKLAAVKNPKTDAYNFDFLLQEFSNAKGASGEGNEGESKNDQINGYDELTNVNELTGYMENILYIPKNMTQMAEMMYL